MGRVTELRPLTTDETPDISDALIVMTVFMQASIERERLMSERFPELALLPHTVELMPGVARAALAGYFDGSTTRAAPLPNAGHDARVGRALAKIEPWMERRWLRLKRTSPGDCEQSTRAALPDSTATERAMLAARCLRCGQCPRLAAEILMPPAPMVRPPARPAPPRERPAPHNS